MWQYISLLWALTTAEASKIFPNSKAEYTELLVKPCKPCIESGHVPVDFPRKTDMNNTKYMSRVMSQKGEVS